LADFGDKVLKSKVVICRSLSVIQTLMSDENQLYNTFYQQVGSQSRIPLDNSWDRGRVAVDGTLFPYYQENMVFGALSLDDRGVKSFGPYALVLKEEMIFRRTTVFEENSFTFCQTKHRIVAGDPVPPGYRAVWSERDRLAMAKLHSKVDRGTLPDNYPGILLSEPTRSLEADFIEVHIYGSIHRTAVERITGPIPKDHSDRVILRSLKRKLAEVGVALDLS
jgi:hypothetical protein